MPEAQRATRIGLVSALNDHYVSPVRLAEYRRKFENTVHRDLRGISIVSRREHLSGTLWTYVECMRAMPTQTTRVLLNRHRPVFMVSEPAAMPVDRVVAAVTTPSVRLADLETLLKRLLLNMLASAPPPWPVPTEIETMLICLLLSAPAPAPASPPWPARNHVYVNDAAASAGNADASPVVESVPGSQGLAYSGVIFLRQTGPRSEQVPAPFSGVGRSIPLHVAGMVGGKGGDQYMMVSPWAATERLRPRNDD